jgi:3-hydroxyisobutyrate dehydrogenase
LHQTLILLQGDYNVTNRRLGFIGVGIMGEAMVRRLLERDWHVTAWNLEAERLDLVVPHGAVAAANPAAVLSKSDVVLCCVLDSAAVRDCVCGPGGLMDSDESHGKVVIDLSTIDPAVTRELAQLTRGAGLGWVDAPVSGGPAAARKGALTIMAGGSDDDLERARTILADLGSNVTAMGPVGAGQTTKIINQAIVGAGYVLMTEAVRLAEAAGIDAARLPSCLAGGFADSALLQSLLPRIQRRDFEPPAAYARQLLKDLKAVDAFAKACECELPLVSAAARRYEQFVSAGNAMQDPASLIRLYERVGPADAGP